MVGKNRTKKRKFTFTDKVHPFTGIMSMIIAIIVVIALVVLFLQSSSMKGAAPLYFGIIGMVAFFLSTIGFFMGVFTFKKEDIFYMFPILGSFLNGILMIFLFSLYMIGIGI